MKTSTPHLLTEDELKLASLNLHEEPHGISIELPIQQMFDEFMVFISKTDFE